MIAVLFLIGATAASARPLIATSMTASLVERDPAGATRLTALSAATPLRPGQVVEYTLVARNTGTSGAHDIRPTVRIPAGTAFRTASVRASDAQATVEYSLDGGRTWSAHPTESARTAQGAQTVRDAAPEHVTDIRWIEPATLAPDARDSFSYEVIVK